MPLFPVIFSLSSTKNLKFPSVVEAPLNRLLLSEIISALCRHSQHTASEIPVVFVSEPGATIYISRFNTVGERGWLKKNTKKMGHLPSKVKWKPILEHLLVLFCVLYKIVFLETRRNNTREWFDLEKKSHHLAKSFNCPCRNSWVKLAFLYQELDEKINATLTVPILHIGSPEAR